MALELVKKEHVCVSPNKIGFYVYSTTEGYYLAEINSETRNMLKRDKTGQVIHSNLLLLTDIDSFKVDSLRVYRELNQRNCFNTLKHLNAIANSKSDYYFNIKDIEGNELVLYTINNQVFIPNCKKIKKIIVDLNETQCFEHIPISIEQDNSTHKLFLAQQKIIRKLSKLLNCEDILNTEITLKQTNKILSRKIVNNRVIYSLEENKKVFQRINIINNNIS